jgi:Tat protein secretion system quality control protein TatD with DNase activity
MVFNVFYRQILEVVAQIKNISEEELAKITYENTRKVFNLRI